ncbi:NADPH:quinone reductase [Methylomarinovum tepidoasis]|uniref:NADPH:quinone reductase n=1 Tax=Methylomarinovum tepidoasis TaxID=2840183 RepID=A0AAU9CVY9_9GAMM|nr:NAD(P)H-quinone oxidoreductase [Methylomarinovum sp. IN45]BCX88304.1 NADPH:quinone reductase [Methylomarinovum sp. IN45]
MKAIEITHPGGPEVLQLTERPAPRPGPGEVLIQVKAAGVNRPDVVQRQGLYPPPPGASDIPGLEVAGIITAVGPEVSQWQHGDAVCALLTGGGYAEYCIAAADLCLPIPKGLDFVQAAAIPETFFTVWHNVFERGQLRRGENFLVHGGAGGIGTTAIQLARALRQAEVYTTCGTPEKCHFCEDLGARAAICYRREDFAARIAELTAGRGVDLILDIVGAPYLPHNLRSLAEDGRLVIIAVQGGPKGEINLLPVFLKRLTITGSTLRPRPPAVKAAIARQLRQHVWPLLESGQVRPIIHRVLPLAQAAEAHRLLEAGEVIGKIVLVP